MEIRRRKARGSTYSTWRRTRDPRKADTRFRSLPRTWVRDSKVQRFSVNVTGKLARNVEKVEDKAANGGGIRS